MVHYFLDFGSREHIRHQGNTNLEKWEEEIDLHLIVSYNNNQEGENYGR